MNIPIFPLDVFLLPDGITRLRVFEQRYLNMVKISAKENGFALFAYGTEQDLVASWVDIINFEMGDDSVLVIDVCCRSLVSLSNVSVDKNNLMWANITKREHWDEDLFEQEQGEAILLLGEILKKHFEEAPELLSLYGNKFVEKNHWIIARWLELLPITVDDKVTFFDRSSSVKAYDFLVEIILNENT